MKAIGVLLVNTGSPDSVKVDDIKKYLLQFLSDPHIVGLPGWIWKPILKNILVPVRAPKSSRRYQYIWGQNGSPLINTTQKLAFLVEEQLNKNSEIHFSVISAMRYGNPSFVNQLEIIESSKVEKIIILPLFPQPSFATTESIRDEITWFSPNKPFTFINGYWNHPAYLTAIKNHIISQLPELPKVEKVLFSFHGLPISKYQHQDTYEEQCKTTAKMIAEACSLPTNGWDISFQSKFGPGKWTEPSTKHVLEQYGKNGIDSVQVFCPGFAVDCLETLHEISFELKDHYLKFGGRKFQYIPALNAGIDHCNALVSIILDLIALTAENPN